MGPEWEELKGWLKDRVKYGGVHPRAEDVLVMMAKIERRTLPKRVASYLDQASSDIIASRYTLTSSVLNQIAEALRTGDTTEIEKWVKKEES